MTETLGKGDQNLIWIDLEMTGLFPDTRPHHRDRSHRHRFTAETCGSKDRRIAVHQSDAALDAMDAWNKGTHGRSGLIDRVKASTLDEAAAEAQIIAFLQQYVPKGKSPDVRQQHLPGSAVPRERRCRRWRRSSTTATWTSAR
ncbi:MAG: exonuclease domain-containing protein [Burkholderiaceae bacterium]